MNRLTRWAAFTALICTASLGFAKIELTVDLKDGAIIASEKTFVLTAKSDQLVTSSEFYVNGRLRGTDDSAPYEFKLDTIAEPEGPLEVKFRVNTNKGESDTKIFKIKIDNKLDQGADFFVNKGTEAMVTSNFDEAIRMGRLALKAKPKYNKARMLLARSNFNKGSFDLAQKFCEDVIAEEPENTDALDLNAAIQLERAFNVVGGDRKANIATIESALTNAAKNRANSYEKRLNALEPMTETNKLQYIDLALASGRYGLVEQALESSILSNPKQTGLANRLIIAQIRRSKWKDASTTITAVIRRGTPDATTNILGAIISQYYGDEATSLQFEKNALLEDSSDLTVRSGQIYLALQRSRASAAGTLVTQLSKEEGQRFEVMYYQSALANIAGEFELARNFFEESVLSEPTSYDTYIQRGNQLVSYSTQANIAPEDAKYQRDLARTLYKAALFAKRESFEAMTGLALLEMIDGNSEEGVKLLENAVKAGSDYAASHYSLSLGYALEATRLANLAENARAKALNARENNLRDEVAKFNKQVADLTALSAKYERSKQVMLQRAILLDKFNLDGRGFPSLLDAYKYFSVRGRTPVLILPGK